MKNNNFQAWTWINQYWYKSFLPNPINKQFFWDDKEINMFLEKANLELGKLDSFSSFIPDIDFFIFMHIWKEAVQSSKIEWTKTEIDDLFINEDIKNPERKNDKQEVKNYIEALNLWMKELEKLPLSFRLFSKIHATLLKWVRWKYKSPWEIRKSQNWIWGSNLQNAFFIPPHQNDLDELITDFEKFLHNNSLQIPELIKVAIIHYQFETIHPYLDWNWRIWRLMIILYLIEKKMLSKPVLYISDFFERNKWSYYDALTIVRNSNDIEHFIKFFLTGIIETCKSSIKTFEEIFKLKKIIDEKLISLWRKAENANIILNYLYSNPIISSQDVIKQLNVVPSTANILLKSFVSLWILKEITWFKKNKLYAFEDYLNIFRTWKNS
jgi:Fic family protein